MIDILAASSIDPVRKTELRSLLAACEAADDASFLEMEKSLNFDPSMKSWFLAIEKGKLLGALSVFAPRREEAEISALVHPARRRSGVFSAPAGPELHGLSFAEVGPERLAELVELRMDAFGDSREDSQSMQRAAFASPRRTEHVALLEGRIVAACSIAHEDAAISLNGIGVTTAQRGKGIAKALIRWTLNRLSASRLPIVLDVESGNARAFGLYTSLGFAVTRAVDYYRRPFPRAM